MTKSAWRNPVLILSCASIVLILSFGIRTSFGVFLAPVTTDLGLGRESFALAIAVQSLLWGISQPFAGAIADRYGSGRVIATCGVLYVLGLVLMAGIVWLMIDIGILSLSSVSAFTWVALIILAVLLGIGMSWSHIWRRMTGQFTADEVE